MPLQHLISSPVLWVDRAGLGRRFLGRRRPRPRRWCTSFRCWTAWRR